MGFNYKLKSQFQSPWETINTIREQLGWGCILTSCENVSKIEYYDHLIHNQQIQYPTICGNEHFMQAQKTRI